jgi:hypothetical protein
MARLDLSRCEHVSNTSRCECTVPIVNQFNTNINILSNTTLSITDTYRATSTVEVTDFIGIKYLRQGSF